MGPVDKGHSITMPVGASADLLDFDRAVAWFLDRIIIDEAKRNEIEWRARSQSWWIAHVAQASVVQSIFDDIGAALKSGDGFDGWRKKAKSKLDSAWTLRGDASARRVELIWRNASQAAYSHGRYEQMNAPAVKKMRPYWMYDAVMDSRVSDLCSGLNGTILPADDPWWDTHTPPLHHQCFPEGTPVITIEGERPIESVRIGDLVLTHSGRFMPVLATMANPSPERLVQVGLPGGRSATATASHPALTTSGWAPFSALRPGDRVFHVLGLGDRAAVRDDHRRVAEGGQGPEQVDVEVSQGYGVETVDVIDNTYVDAPSPRIFNLSVAEDETYFASGILVHNCRSGIRSLRRSVAEKRGISDGPPVDGKGQPLKAQDGFGYAPTKAPDPGQGHEALPLDPELAGVMNWRAKKPPQNPVCPLCGDTMYKTDERYLDGALMCRRCYERAMDKRVAIKRAEQAARDAARAAELRELKRQRSDRS